MKRNKSNQDAQERVLAIFYNSRGFGYAVMDSQGDLLVASMHSSKRANSEENLNAVKELIDIHRPERMVVEDHTCASSKKCNRIQKLIQKTISYCDKIGLAHSSYSRNNIQAVFLPWHAKTRYEIAEVISRNIKSLQAMFFAKPKYPKIEHYRSGMFDAVSLAMTHYQLK